MTRAERAKKFRNTRKRKRPRHSAGSRNPSRALKASKTSAKIRQASPQEKEKSPAERNAGFNPRFSTRGSYQSKSALRTIK
ncbi:hypothetical protein CJ240_02100 [Varibaculum cambriense]|uniref:Uncharacterized protein n=1 Tax=Varibaculum cambriense TaxID=184870 RepID=A0ABX4UQM0_9ACTO|nr:hypothetical protein CJ240_02100 [Varibaculum cambriense]